MHFCRKNAENKPDTCPFSCLRSHFLVTSALIACLFIKNFAAALKQMTLLMFKDEASCPNVMLTGDKSNETVLFPIESIGNPFDLYLDSKKEFCYSSSYSASSKINLYGSMMDM